MNYAIIKKLPPVDEIIQAIPLSNTGYQQIIQDREEVKAILEGTDKRLLMIVGPCSAWPKAAVLEYASQLLRLNEQVKHALKIVMRVYIQKPRTTRGWTGPVNQPDPLAYPDIAAGIYYTRDMMVKIVEMGLPIADEALFTHNAIGFLELLSWVAIGARSAEDQEHRIFASAIECAVGLKNPTHGSLVVGINSVLAAQYPHVAAFDGYEVQTQGNAYAHLVLRGSAQEGPNYGLSHLKQVQEIMTVQTIKNPAVIIDASHDNCILNGKKDLLQQPKVVFEVMDILKQNPELNIVKGFMVESFLKEGAQKIDNKNQFDIQMDGLSITDPCLSWEGTEQLLLKLTDIVESQSK